MDRLQTGMFPSHLAATETLRKDGQGRLFVYLFDRTSLRKRLTLASNRSDFPSTENNFTTSSAGTGLVP